MSVRISGATVELESWATGICNNLFAGQDERIAGWVRYSLEVVWASEDPADVWIEFEFLHKQTRERFSAVIPLSPYLEQIYNEHPDGFYKTFLTQQIFEIFESRRTFYA